MGAALLASDRFLVPDCKNRKIVVNNDHKSDVMTLEELSYYLKVSKSTFYKLLQFTIYTAQKEAYRS